MRKPMRDHLTLKWGTLKSWKFSSPTAVSLVDRYIRLGSSASAALQKDTPEQKEIICELINLFPGRVYLDWEGKYISKAQARKYVLDYGKE